METPIQQCERLIIQYIAAGIFYRFDVQEQQHWFALADFMSDTLDMLFKDDTCLF